MLLVALVIISIVSGQPCTFTDSRGSGYELDLRALDGKTIYGATSSNNYSYTPCENDLTCSYGQNKNQKGMSMVYNGTDCYILAEMSGIQPYWDNYVQTWSFAVFTGGIGVFRVDFICNKSITNDYNTLFFGAMGDGVFGVTVESPHVCPVNETRENNINNNIESDIYDINIYATPCNTVEDCSYNGICKNKVCDCDAGWKGEHCAQLNLQMTTKESGYHNFDGGMNVSSWGGSVIKGVDNKYHMYAAEMADWCGINAWRPNSILIHAISDTYNGKYTKTDEIALVWTHEPTACVGPNGEYVVYAVHSPYPNGGNSDISPCQGCANGATLDCDIQLTTGPPNPKTYTQMKYTSISNGSSGYSDWMIIPTQDENGQDSCLACYIYPNGSLIALFEGDFDNGEDMYIQYATNWKDNTTYTFYHAKIPTGLIVEDPYIWQDKNGILHAIFHNDGWDTPFGYHAYSTDNGRVWKGYDQSITAYDDLTYYDDGDIAEFVRVERPHIIMDDDGYTPIALTNSAKLGGKYLDYSFTLLRPINTDKNNKIKYKMRDFSKAKRKIRSK